MMTPNQHQHHSLSGEILPHFGMSDRSGNVEQVAIILIINLSLFFSKKKQKRINLSALGFLTSSQAEVTWMGVYTWTQPILYTYHHQELQNTGMGVYTWTQPITWIHQNHFVCSKVFTIIRSKSIKMKL